MRVALGVFGASSGKITSMYSESAHRDSSPNLLRLGARGGNDHLGVSDCLTEVRPR